MRHLRKTLLTSAALLALVSCSTNTQIIAGSNSDYGFTGQYNTASQTAVMNMGALQNDFVVSPLAVKGANGTETPLLVRSGCDGRQNAVSTFGSITGNTTAGAATTTNPASVTFNLGRSLATGAVADLIPLTTLQQAYGPDSKHDALADFECETTNAPTP